MYDIIIKNGYVLDMVEKNFSTLDNSSMIKDIVIKDNKIVKIEKDTKQEAKKVIDASGLVVMPGFVNCHNHAFMTLFRGYKDDMELMSWLKTVTWPVEGRLEREDVYYPCLLACIEMIKSGTTTFNDMYFFMDMCAKAVSDTKIRAMLGRCVMDIKDENDYRVLEAISLYEKYNNAENGRIKVNIAPHALYTCNKEAIEVCKKLSKKYNIPFHIHLDETTTEHNDIMKKYGMTPTKLLDSYGIFDECNVILAHSVWCDEEDIKILKKIKGGIVHNPISNSKLASGIAPICKYIENGINVSLGTDGAGSTTTLDMFEEMRLCNYLQKVSTLNPTCINAYEVLKMATINGAKTLSLQDEIGSLEVGKKADIILVDMKGAHVNPVNDICSNLVYSSNGADVLTTIVDGNILMENRKLLGIDEKKVIIECNKLAKKYFV